MIVKFKKLHSDAVIPSYAKDGDAAMDLTAVDVYFEDTTYIEYRTGLAVEIPKGHFGYIRPRSSVSKMDMTYATSGVIDSGYRGEVTVRFKMYPVQRDTNGRYYERGDRVAQLIIVPCPEFELQEVDELSDSERGTGGHGSTGN